MSGFKDLLDKLPKFEEAWEKKEWVDPASGVAIVQMIPPSVLQAPKFGSSLMIQTSQGNIPLSFEIHATSLDEAVRGWNAAARQAVTEFDEQMQKNARRIVMPTPAMMPGRPHA